MKHGNRHLQRYTVTVLACTSFLIMASLAQDAQEAAPPTLPQIVAPGTTAAHPPADADILFDGTSASLAAHWSHPDGRPAEWVVDEQARCMTIKPGSGSLISVEQFGDAQIHIEFATPTPAQGQGQGRGNSGVYMQARYEVQVLDSYENETYPDGQCGAIYGHHPPLVNASRPPGHWQTYDIIFHAPTLVETSGEPPMSVLPGTMTVFHNGVLIHDHAEFKGSTTASLMKEDMGPGPLYLQDHGNGVRYRNIWVREL
ncbi:MAG: DUF1080 domain-containing protein [Planctomycetes bacterium]|nr:DUF1080 domain-containing protein [Planctomycetota bacterium]NOG54390.1 DUF1080 domain-containing protein [Planctomycetota bacterium]